MAGHSQFKNIMYRKGAQDKKRGKVFTKIIRELTTAARSGLPDPNANPRLRAAVLAARQANMPKDTVERAIKRGAGGDVVISAPEDFNSVRDALEQRFGPAASAGLGWRPKTATVLDEDAAAGLFKLLETLEDSDDVQNVYANFEVAEDVLARLSA